MITVYAVVFSNYLPFEIDSLWTTKVLAAEQAMSLSGDWRVVPMEVKDERQEG